MYEITENVLMDSTTGMSCLQNQVQPKNKVMKVNTVLLCGFSIRRHLCSKLQKVDKGGDIRHKPFPCIPEFTANELFIVGESDSA